MEDGRPAPRKKRKSGGSFCAEGTCSNNSHRNKTSVLEGRGFLRYYYIPRDPHRRREWASRMKRELGWKPSDHTRICSDHFHDDDFVAADIEKHRKNLNLKTKKEYQIHLKEDATPNTDRSTGYRSEPLKAQVLNYRQFRMKRRLQGAKPSSSTVILGISEQSEVKPKPESKLPQSVSSSSKVNKGCQIGSCFLLQQRYCREQEVNNFQMLEQILGPEEEDEHVRQSFGCGGEEEDPDWSYLDEHVGVERDSARDDDGRGIVFVVFVSSLLGITA